MDGKVMVAWCDDGEVCGAFADSVIGLIAAGSANGVVSGWLRREGGPVLSKLRNDLTEGFLKTGHEWMLMVDADMRFAPDMLDRLLQVADPERCPVVGPVCYTMTDKDLLFPVIYRMRLGRFWRVDQVPVDDLIGVDGIGTGCLLIHRTVFDRITSTNSLGRWFDPLYLNGEPCGEDLSFCVRARAAGIPLHAHTGIPIAHLRGKLALDEKVFRMRN